MINKITPVSSDQIKIHQGKDGIHGVPNRKMR